MESGVTRATDATAIVVPVPITAGMLWILFALILACFIAISWMFLHHWSYYGVDGNNRVFIKGLYFVASIGLLVLAALLISAYALTT